MLPFFKIFSLLVRILARPIISRTKAATSSRIQDVRTRAFFVWIGNKTHKVNVLINRKFLKIDSADFKVHELSEPAALELGVETFYEFFIYACILGLPIIEILKGQAEAEEKSAKQKKEIDDLYEQLNKLGSQSQKQQSQIQHLFTINDLLRSKSSLIESAFITEKLLKKKNPDIISIQAIQREVEVKQQHFNYFLSKE